MDNIVCSYCGGSLTNKKIWGEDFERTICENCSKVEFGVPEKIYKIANQHVRNNFYSYYSLDKGTTGSSEEEIEMNKEGNISQLSHLFWCLLTEYNKNEV